jgi:hypothetical protein
MVLCVSVFFNSMSFKLQYASNLFVDRTLNSFSKLVKPAAPHLALLGNIGRPESPKTYHFLRYCAKHWDNVFWIPGPHELSNPKGSHLTLSEKRQNASSLTKQIGNVTLMDSKEAVFHDQRIVLFGTPLWTKLLLPPKGEPEFNSIFTCTEKGDLVPLTHRVRNELHKEDLFFLKERSLFWSIVHPDVNVLYLTHTLPTSRLYKSKMSDEAWKRFYMDCLRLPMSSPLRAWLGGAAGLTHTEDIHTKSDQKVICGVNGLYEYPFTSTMNPSYNPTCVLEIEPMRPSPLAPCYLPNLVLPPLLSSLLPQKVSLVYA